MTKQELIDLAVEYGMVLSSWDFYQRSEKAQEKILQVIAKVAKQ